MNVYRIQNAESRTGESENQQGGEVGVANGSPQSIEEFSARGLEILSLKFTKSTGAIGGPFQLGGRTWVLRFAIYRSVCCPPQQM